MADLVVTKAGTPEPAQVGGVLTYEIIVANVGTVTASQVEVEDKLPSGVVFVSAVSGQGTCGLQGGRVWCTLGGLRAGQEVLITITVVPLVPNQPITNIVIVDPQDKVVEGDETNNVATAVNGVR